MNRIHSLFSFSFFVVLLELTACNPKTSQTKPPITKNDKGDPKSSQPAQPNQAVNTQNNKPQENTNEGQSSQNGAAKTPPAIEESSLTTENKPADKETPTNAYLGYISISAPKQFLPWLPQKDMIQLLTSSSTSLEQAILPNLPIVAIFWEPSIGVAEAEKAKRTAINQFPIALFLPLPEDNSYLNFLSTLADGNAIHITKQKYGQGTVLFIGEQTEDLWKRDFHKTDGALQDEFQNAQVAQPSDVKIQLEVDAFLTKYEIAIEHFLIGNGEYLISELGKKAFQRFLSIRDKQRFSNKALQELSQNIIQTVIKSIINTAYFYHKTFSTEISHSNGILTSLFHLVRPENEDSKSFVIAPNQKLDLLSLLPENSFFQFQQNSLWEKGPRSQIPCGLVEQYRYQASDEMTEKMSQICKDWEENLQGLRFASAIKNKKGLHFFTILAPSQPIKFWETLQQTIGFLSERQNLKSEFSVQRKENQLTLTFTHQKLRLFSLSFTQKGDYILAYFGRDPQEEKQFHARMSSPPKTSFQQKPLFQDTGILYGNLNLGEFFSIIGKYDKNREGMVFFYSKGDAQTQDTQIQMPSQAMKSILGATRSFMTPLLKKVIGR